MHLDRLIRVLETIAIAGRPVSATELHQITDLPKPTCYRMLQMLTEQRLLDEPESSSRYVIGERLIRIVLLARTDASIGARVTPLLKDAACEFGEAVFLSRLRNTGVKIIHVETPVDPAIAYMHPGLGYRPVHACSCSKAIIAFADEPFRNTVLKGPMKSYTQNTRTSKQDLLDEFAQIRKRGFAECVEEIEVGVSSIAAPVQMVNLGAVFSIGTIGPIRRFNKKHRQQLGKKLIEKARGVSSAIQFNEHLLAESENNNSIYSDATRIS